MIALPRRTAATVRLMATELHVWTHRVRVRTQRVPVRAHRGLHRRDLHCHGHGQHEHRQECSLGVSMRMAGMAHMEWLAAFWQHHLQL